MSKRDWNEEGGAAFSVPADPTEHGMSLRDWFAGMALQGLAACPAVTAPNDVIVREAWKLADAMLAERAK